VGKKKVTRVVIDTNVVVSGLLFSGVPGEIVSLWQKRRVEPFASADIINEYIRVLAYPKFKLTEEDIDYLLHVEILPYFSTVVIDQYIYKIVRQDPTDDKFLMCAEAAKARTVISGDRHLLSLGSYKGIDILTPQQLIDIL
jgi:putative PIN family toxin of toxin-antitoxin system